LIELDKYEPGPAFKKCGHPLSEENIYYSKRDGCKICKMCRNANSQAAHKKWITAEPGRAREHHLKVSYKITLQDYERMFKKQKGVCAICKLPAPEGKLLFVDHNHKCCPKSRCCGKCVRGLLCQMCNHGIGNFLDDVERMKSAVAYVQSYSSLKQGDL
jgi:hypothetical protein